ncbi:hypothetical protein, partial [Aeromonas molluscorum]
RPKRERPRKKKLLPQQSQHHPVPPAVSLPPDTADPKKAAIAAAIARAKAKKAERDTISDSKMDT